MKPEVTTSITLTGPTLATIYERAVEEFSAFFGEEPFSIAHIDVNPKVVMATGKVSLWEADILARTLFS